MITNEKGETAVFCAFQSDDEAAVELTETSDGEYTPSVLRLTRLDVWRFDEKLINACLAEDKTFDVAAFGHGIDMYSIYPCYVLWIDDKRPFIIARGFGAENTLPMCWYLDDPKFAATVVELPT